MTRFRHNQSSFAVGEVSDEAAGRIDIDELKQGAKLISNYAVTKTAGLFKRSGSRYVTAVSAAFFGVTSSFGGPALIPFIVSKKIAFLIAIKGSGRAGVGDADAPVMILKNDYAGTRLLISSGEWTCLYGDIIPAALEARDFVFAQNGDQLFITHASGTVQPMVVTRIGTDEFVVAQYNGAVDTLVAGLQTNTLLRRPYRKNLSAITLTPSVTVGSGTLTASAPMFEADHVGMYFQITHGALTGMCKVTSFTSTTVVNMTVETIHANLVFGATTASDNWSIEAWGVIDGYPTSVGFYEGRAVWGGTVKEPGKLSFTQFGNIFHVMEEKLEQDKGVTTDVSGLNYFGDVLETDPFSMELGNKEANQISWIDSSDNLQVGTLGAEFIVTDTNEGAFSLLTARRKLQSSYGSKAGKVVRVGDRLLFISRTGRSIRDYKQNKKNGSHVSADMNLMHNEIYKHGTIDANDTNFTSDQFVDLALQSINDLVWFVNSRNELVTLTVSDELKTIAWSRYSLAGVNVNVWGLASIPNEAGDYDDMYISLERTVDGVRKFYVEKIGQPFESNTIDASADIGSNTIEDSRFDSLVPRYLDSYVAEISASTKTTMGGLGHLTGDDVVVCINGTRIADTFTVAAGVISGLPSHDTGDILIAGLLYEAEVILLDPDQGANDGDAQGAVKHLDRVDIQVVKTLGLKVSEVGGKFTNTVKFDAVEVETGLKSIKLTGSPSKNIHVSIKSVEPYPCTIIGVCLRGVLHD